MQRRLRGLSSNAKTKNTRTLIKVSSNISQVAASLSSKLQEFNGVIKDKIAREVASDQLGRVHDRIHEDGKKADGSQIGEYSSNYLKKREKNNRTEGSKVVISLTRKLENEFTIIPTEKGYGLGWLANDRGKTTNTQISKYMEEKYGDIWKLTTEEKSAIKPVADRVLKEELSRLNLL